MPRRLPRRALLPIVALTLAACTDAAPVAPRAASADDALLAKGQTRPTGKGIGVIGTKTNRARTEVEYHGGAMMYGTLPVYLIWYGLWEGSPVRPIIADFVSNLGGSSYYQIIELYKNPAGDGPANAVLYAGAIDDSYSHGSTLSESDVDAIVSTTIASGMLPSDPNGVYVVLTSADVSVTSGFGTSSGTSYCAFRRFTSVNNVPVKYAFVGNPDRAPAQCEPQTVSPNGSAAADAIVSILANVIANSATDPLFSGWYDRNGLEPADKCAWSYGDTYTTANGARANVRVGGRDYLLQQLWVPGERGHCALEAPGL